MANPTYHIPIRVNDPTQDEMLDVLRRQFGDEIDWQHDAQVAIYWFAHDHHGGQWTNLYSVLSTSIYRPSILASGIKDEIGDMLEWMYDTLVDEFVRPARGKLTLIKVCT
jgi:hypothetical protein